MDKFRLNFVHIAENVIVGKDDKLSIINTFNKIYTGSFPTVHPAFSIIASVYGPPGSYNEKITIIDPNGQAVITSMGQIIIEDNKKASFVAFFTNTIFPLAGEYTIEVRIGDAVLRGEEKLILEKK